MFWLFAITLLAAIGIERSKALKPVAIRPISLSRQRIQPTSHGTKI